MPTLEAEFPRAGLDRLVAKVSFFRLILFFLLLFLLALVWTENVRLESYFIPHRPYLFSALMVAGFGTSILYLITWKKWLKLRLFFLLQLCTDLFLTCMLVFLSGGIKSNFVFLFWGIVFLYGRILGGRCAFYTGLAILALLQVIAWFQFEYPFLWGGSGFGVNEIFYLSFLQSLGVVLTVMLVLMGKGREDRLVLKLLQHEVALEESERLKKEVFDWMDSGLVVTDTQGRISTVNRKALEYTPTESREAVLQESLAGIFPHLARIRNEFGGDSKLHELEAPNGDIFAVRVTSLPQKQGDLIFFSDITEVRKLEKQVFQMEKLATTGELAAGLAHEMKNPLAGLKGALQLTGPDEVDPGTAHRLHNVIERDIKRLDNLLRDFLVFARPKGSRKKEADLGEIVRHCLDILQSQFSDVHVEVFPRLQDKKWRWDPEQLQQVLLNLFLNAAQAACVFENPWIGADWEEIPEGEQVVILDNGPGVPQEAGDKIYDPFYTTKSQGSGLGLSIAQRLAAQNDSRIVLENRETGGAAAYIRYIPGQGQ